MSEDGFHVHGAHEHVLEHDVQYGPGLTQYEGRQGFVQESVKSDSSAWLVKDIRGIEGQLRGCEKIEIREESTNPGGLALLRSFPRRQNAPGSICLGLAMVTRPLRFSPATAFSLNWSRQ
jgi:hypothetical protein